MLFRPAILVLLAAFIFLSGFGCKKTGSRAVAPPTVLSPDTIASVHWRGKHWLGYEATAFFFMRIWDNPSSARLERQTLERIALASDKISPGTSGLMLPLLSDLEQEESYLEIRAATNSQPAAVLAIHLPGNEQAGRWFTNLPSLLQPLTGTRVVVNPIDQTWSLPTTNAIIRLTRAGEWTLLSVGPENNPLLADIAARIARDSEPFVSSGTNLWFEASLDPARLANFFPSLAPQLSVVARLNLTVTGDGGSVFTRGKIAFAQPFAAPLPPWNLPVNLLHDPLMNFIAVRGVGSALAGWPPWRDLQMGDAPDELFFWSLAGSPYQTYLAAPLTNANESVAALTDHLLQKGNPWLAANGYISFDRAADGNGVTWGSLPDIKPFIKSAGGWFYAGLLPETNAVALPPSPGLLNDVLRRTNLVYYGWEVTGPRLQPVLSVAQTARLILRRPQLPGDSAAMTWLGFLIPRLGTSATIATRTGPAEITFVRRSTIGLDAVELHVLAGWLESSAFPQ